MVLTVGVTEYDLGVMLALLPLAVPAPRLFSANIVNVYAVPGVNPVKLIVPELAVNAVPVSPPGVEVATYLTIVSNPLDAGCVYGINTLLALATVIVPIEGVPGTVADTLLLLDALNGLTPYPFVAYTVKVYAVPSVNPVTLIVPESAVLTVTVIFPGVDVAVYEVIGTPPSDVGFV